MNFFIATGVYNGEEKKEKEAWNLVKVMLEMNSWRKLIVCVFLEMQARDAKSILEQPWWTFGILSMLLG